MEKAIKRGVRILVPAILAGLFFVLPAVAGQDRNRSARKKGPATFPGRSS